MSSGMRGRPGRGRCSVSGGCQTSPRASSSAVCRETAAALSPVSRMIAVRASGPRCSTARSTAAAPSSRSRTGRRPGVAMSAGSIVGPLSGVGHTPAWQPWYRGRATGRGDISPTSCSDAEKHHRPGQWASVTGTWWLCVASAGPQTGRADFHGELLTGTMAIPAPPAESGVPLLVAAMALQALRARGEPADGIQPYAAGARALKEHMVPTLRVAAEAGDTERRPVAHLGASRRAGRLTGW